MKVIDLLNKIANGEHPKKFKLHLLTDYIYELNDNGNYYNIITDEEFTESINLIFCLNDEVEIIADTPKVQVEMTQEEFFKYLDRKLDTPKEYKVSAKDFLDNQFKGLYPQENQKIEEAKKFIDEILPILTNIKEQLDKVNGDK